MYKRQANHLRADVRAEQLGVDIVTGGRDERQQRPGEHAGHRQGQGDRAEGGEAVGVEDVYKRQGWHRPGCPARQSR